MAMVLGHLISIYRRMPVKPFRGIIRKLFISFNRHKVVIAKRDEITYELHLDERIDSTIYYEGCFEPGVVAIINRYVKRGMTVLDIGANIGCHTLRLAKLVGQDGRVIAFEPSTWACHKLKRNMQLNNFNNIRVENLALSNESKGAQTFQFYASWPLEISQNEKERINPYPHGRKMEDLVEVSTLDNWVRREKIQKIDFMKIDTDGCEYKVIQGGVGCIKEFRPTMVLEFGRYTLAEQGDSLEGLVELLASLGYGFYSESDLKRYATRESLLNAVPEDSTIDVLCRPKSLGSEGSGV